MGSNFEVSAVLFKICNYNMSIELHKSRDQISKSGFQTCFSSKILSLNDI